MADDHDAFRRPFELPHDSKFAGAYPVTAVLLHELGFCSIGVLTYYSSVYHRDVDMWMPAAANVATAFATVLHLLIESWFSGSHALVLCAMSNPLQELINFVVIIWLSRGQVAG